MLVLARRKGESLLIGDDIEITVVGIYQSRDVRLGIEAPEEVKVLRREVKEADNA